MKHLTFLTHLNAIKKAPLGGIKAQFKLAPETRKIRTMNAPHGAKKAAVLILFYSGKNNNTHVLLTLRANYNGVHSNQVSFPGGKRDLDDKDLKETALRECFEEVGIAPERVTLLKEMTNVYIPPSNFLVTPYMAYAIGKLNFTPNREVAQVLETPLSDLLNDDFVHFEIHKLRGTPKVQIPYFQLNDHKVWGATAMIISEVKELLKPLSF
jgi:8-oxo-dGTP pyrophosphatase MutT (NUDIX family)